MKSKFLFIAIFTLFAVTSCFKQEDMAEHDETEMQNWREMNGIRKVPDGWERHVKHGQITWHNPNYSFTKKNKGYYQKQQNSVVKGESGLPTGTIIEDDTFFSGKMVKEPLDADRSDILQEEKITLRYYIHDGKIIKKSAYIYPYLPREIKFEEALKLVARWCTDEALNRF
jgi:hypothetical protein